MSDDLLPLIIIIIIIIIILIIMIIIIIITIFIQSPQRGSNRGPLGPKYDGLPTTPAYSFKIM